MCWSGEASECSQRGAGHDAYAAYRGPAAIWSLGLFRDGVLQRFTY